MDNCLDRDDFLALFRGLERQLVDLRSLIEVRQKELMTVEELARLVGRSAFTVRRWISQGKIEATRVNGTGPRGRLLVRRSELAKLLSLGSGAEIPPGVLPASDCC